MIETYSHGPNRASGDFCLAWRHRILHRTESHKSLREFDESRRPAEDSVLRASTGSLPQDGAQGRCLVSAASAQRGHLPVCVLRQLEAQLLLKELQVLGLSA